MKRRRDKTAGADRREKQEAGLFRDVENLAVVAADTAVRLDARGLHDLARPLVEALERLGRRRR